MIGDEIGARAALAGELELLAVGTERRVFRDGDVVYKVDLRPYDGANKDEWQRYRQWQKGGALPGGLRIPRTTGYSLGGVLVLAAEYVEGRPMRVCDRVQVAAVADLRDEPPPDDLADYRCLRDGQCIDDSLGRRLVLELEIVDLDEGNLIEDAAGVLWLIDYSY